MIKDVAFDNVFRPPTEWKDPIFTWSAPRFESVYILLHPFVKVPLEFHDFIEPYGSRWLEDGMSELLLDAKVEHETWENIRLVLNLPSIASLLSLVNANATGMVNADYDMVKILVDYLLENKILAPTTHYIPPILREKILLSIERYGIGDPKWGGTIEMWPYERENLIYATPYEAAFSLICSTRDIVDQIVLENKFEGFFADENTLLDWSASV